MSELDPIPEWLRKPQNYRWIIPFIMLISIFFFVRSCFREEEVSNRYVIARDGTWYPQNFYGEESNVLGFSDDLLYNIAKLKKLSIRLVSSNPGHILEMLENGESVDGVLSSLQPDVILRSKYLFSERYYDLGAVLVVRVDSSIKEFADIKGGYLGIRRGANILFNIKDAPPVTVVTYDSRILMLDDIIRDKIDGALMNQLNGYNTTTFYYKGKLRVATPPLTDEGLRLVTLNRNREKALIEAFNEGLEELKQNGTYDELLRKWELPNPKG